MSNASSNRLEQLLARFAARDRLALARLITLVENRDPGVATAMERLYSRDAKAHIVGVTGAPGAGKSTLIDRLVAKLRARKQQVAVLAIDPSSPFSGGAVLGDRVRMGDHYSDPGVYIRSLSTRGSHGGLSRAARQIVTLLEAFKFDVIIVETAGVGQTELDIMDLAQTTVVVTVPEGGDGIQIMKAGLNEIADIFVVNKADRDGADRVKAELELNVHLRGSAAGWSPPVLLTQAANDRGIESVIAQLDRHREYLRTHADPQTEQQRRAHEFVEILGGQLEERARQALGNGRAHELMESVRAGRLNPYAAVRMLLDDPSAVGTLLRKTVVDY
jgi:LAO/AO transport system kinase